MRQRILDSGEFHWLSSRVWDVILEIEELRAECVVWLHCDLSIDLNNSSLIAQIIREKFELHQLIKPLNHQTRKISSQWLPVIACQGPLFTWTERRWRGDRRFNIEIWMTCQIPINFLIQLQLIPVSSIFSGMSPRQFLIESWYVCLRWNFSSFYSQLFRDLINSERIFE